MPIREYWRQVAPGAPANRPRLPADSGAPGAGTVAAAGRAATAAGEAGLGAARRVLAAERTAAAVDRQVDTAEGEALSGVGAAMVKLAAQQQTLEEEATRVRQATRTAELKAKALRAVQQRRFDLENGTVDEKGNRVPPPDPTTRLGAFDEFQKKIEEEARGQLDPDSYKSFENEFRTGALNQRLTLQGTVIKHNLDEAEAETERTINTAEELWTGARDAAGNPNVRERATYREMGLTAINGLARRAGKDATDVQKRSLAFEKRLTMADLRHDMRTNPSRAIRALSGDLLPGFNADEQEQWLTRGVQELDRQRRLELAIEDRNDRKAREREKEESDAAHKELAKLKSPTVEDVLKYETTLSAERFDSWMEKARKGHDDDKVVDDNARLTHWREEAVKVRTPAQLETFANGIEKDVNPEPGNSPKLKSGTYLTLMAVAEGNVYDGKRPPGFSDARDNIIGITGGEQSVNPLAPILRARGLTALARWTISNPNAKPEQIIAEGERIAESVSLFANITAGMLTPRFLAGGRSKPDLAATWAATEKALEEGRISKTEAAAEGQLIAQWRHALEAATQK